MIVPFGQDAEMQILQYDGTGWRARICRRGLISRVIGDVKSQLGEIDFYHQEGRAIAEHEMSQYQVVCIVPRSHAISEADFTAEEEL